jgi:glycosyltransferase involved in cell wall biosynthesis
MTRTNRILLGVTSDISLTLLRGLPQQLLRSGWEVHIVSSPGPAMDEMSLTEGVYVHSIAMSREPSPIADLKALLEWVRLLRRIRPVLISVGTPKAGLLGMLAGAVNRVPRRIYLLRGLRLETTSGLRRLIFKALERVTVLCSHNVLAVSSSLREEAIRLRIVPAPKIQVLGAGSSNGVDVNHFHRSRFSADDIRRVCEELNLVEGIPVIGFVGRLNVDKGLEVLADARVLLDNAGVDHQLLLVGEAERGGDVPLERLFRAGRFPALTGKVKDPAIYYHMMDVLCLPTLREGFPNVVLEAASAGIPCVTTDATGAVDSVLHGTTGLVTAVGSATSLAIALEKVLQDEKLRIEMGQNAKTWVSKNFRRKDVQRRMNEYYISQVAGHRLAR